MHRRPLALALAALGLTTAALLPVRPAAADDDQVLNVSVRMAAAPAPCIRLARTAPLDLGTAEFATKIILPADAGQVTNCGSETQTLSARYTSPRSDDGTATWAPATSIAGTGIFCGPTSLPNRVSLTTSFSDLPDNTVQATMQEMEAAHLAGTTEAKSLVLNLPCDGSTGAGKRMSFQLVYLATLA